MDFSLAYAQKKDEEDPLRESKDLYVRPTMKALGKEGGDDSTPAIYMAGNSLGLQPKSTVQVVQEEMAVWGERAVLGHFDHPHDRPWKSIDEHITPLLSEIVGANEREVACTSTLTSNLNSLFISFYRPTNTRYKILVEEKAFPSDMYAIQSHLHLHSPPSDALLLVKPRDGEFSMRTSDIIDILQSDEGSSIALVWLPGIQYYTGEVFEMKEITKAGHAAGCIVGFDLAHAVGNIPLQLHDWNVDFAVWCSYKYLNSGPGAVGGLFVHEKWDSDEEVPRLAGWWGHNTETRFKMPFQFEPMKGAGRFQHSNPPLYSIVPVISALQTLKQVGGLPALRKKSVEVTAYLETLLQRSEHFVSNTDKAESRTKPFFRILTPSEPHLRGTQISIQLFSPPQQPIVPELLETVFNFMVKKYGVMGDERRPDVIRLAPVPAYCGWVDCWVAAKALDEAMASV